MSERWRRARQVATVLLCVVAVAWVVLIVTEGPRFSSIAGLVGASGILGVRAYEWRRARSEDS